MGAALLVIIVALGALAAGVLIGRYYVPDDRQLRRTARHSRAYMKALSHLISREHESVVDELRNVVEENVDDVEPYFALGALFRSRGEYERAIRVHQALAVRERDKRKLRQRAMFELGLDFRGAGMPRRATKAMEEVLVEDPGHEAALRVLAALYEEQSRFSEAAELWQRIAKKRDEDTTEREHHLFVAAAQLALGREDLDHARTLLRAANKHGESAHYFTAAAELAAARGNHLGAKQRLRQALVAEPALAPHLVPGLVAAEEHLAVGGSKHSRRDELDDPTSSMPALPAISEEHAQTERALPAPQPIADADSRPTVAAKPGAIVAAGTVGAGRSAEHAAVSPADVVSLPGVSLIGPVKPEGTVAERVLATLSEVEAETGPRLELALARAQLVAAEDESARATIANELVVRFPDALAARVAAARLATSGGQASEIKAALDVLVGDAGSLAWTLRGRWQCAGCSARPAAFAWRCPACRRWGSLRIETGVEPPPKPVRERRATPRPSRPEGLLGAPPDNSLPAPTLDPGLTADELARAGKPRSLLDRVGGWFRR